MRCHGGIGRVSPGGWSGLVRFVPDYIASRVHKSRASVLGRFDETGYCVSETRHLGEKGGGFQIGNSSKSRSSQQNLN